MFHFFVMLASTLVIVEIVMLIYWVIYLFYRHVSVVDIAWATGLIAAVVVDFILGYGFIWRKILVLIIVLIWVSLLVGQFAMRFLPNREDLSDELRLNHWPFANFPLFQVFTLFVFQGVLITILSIPFALMNQNLLPFFSTYEMYGLLIWMGGIVGKSVADIQLNHFNQSPENRGRVCEQGLWKYSRHPNDYFEWIVWMGYSIMALSSPWGWLGLISPILMLYLLLKVSGVPHSCSFKTRWF